MALEVEGKLLKKFETVQITATFKKREFVLETEGQYPQPVKFDLAQDRCVLLDNYQEGERIKVSFDLRGREWNGKYFTDLSAWRLERAGGGAPTGSATPPSTSAPSSNITPMQTPPAGNADDDDLPF